MNGLCTGVGWADSTLNMELRSGEDKEQAAVAEGTKLAIELVGTRQCIGYRAPGSDSLVPCPDNARDLSSAQCAACFERAMILPCLRCTGESCHNAVRRNSCIQPDNHAVYLASFAPGLLKTGVARWERRFERLAEQGARAGIIIACDDGLQVRRVESQMRRCGIPDRLSPTEKLTGLTVAGSQAELVAELKAVFAANKIRTIGKWLPEVEEVALPELRTVKQQPRLKRPSAGLRLRGEVLQICGQIAIMAADTGETVAVELPTLVGYELRELDDSEHGEGQLALAFA